MLAAGFGDTRFFVAEGNHFPKGSPFYSAAGTDLYNQRNANKAKDAGRQGRLQGRADPRADQPPVRLPLQHGARDGRAAQARRLQGRPATWSTGPRWCSAATTRSCGTSTSPTRASSPSRCSRRRNWATARRAGGSTPAKKAALAAFNQEADPAKRGALWGKVQQVVYDEVPYIKSASSTACRRRARRWTATRPRPGRSSGTRGMQVSLTDRAAFAHAALPARPAWPACSSCSPSSRCWCSC